MCVYVTFGFNINPDSVVRRKFMDVPAKVCNTLKSHLYLVSTVGWHDAYMYLTEKVYSQKWKNSIRIQEWPFERENCV